MGTHLEIDESDLLKVSEKKHTVGTENVRNISSHHGGIYVKGAKTGKR